jgi:hypothetical protein
MNGISSLVDRLNRLDGGLDTLLHCTGNFNVGVSCTDAQADLGKFVVRTTTNRLVALGNFGSAASVTAFTDAGVSTTLRLAGSTLVLSGNGSAGAEHARIDTSGNLLIGTTTASAKLFVNGDLRTAAPVTGTAANWKLGIASVVSPTAPNRTIQLDVGGTLYFLHAKTTNN